MKEGLPLGFPLSRDFSDFQVPGLLDFFSPGTTGPRDLQGLQVLSPGRPGTFAGLPGTSRDQISLCFCTFMHFF